jgi:hypothetical protein
MSRLQYGGDEERRERESTFSRLLRNARLPDTWHLDLDDIFYEYMSSSTAALIFFLTLLIMIFLRNKFDVVFWTVLVISIIFLSFYVYWVCIRSPSQYYEYSNVHTMTTQYQTRSTSNSHAGGEPAEILTTDDIMNTTTYQAAPAFRSGSILVEGDHDATEYAQAWPAV